MSAAPPDVCLVGAGEYIMGFVETAAGAASDKPAGVVALTMLDLKRRGLVDRIVLCDAAPGKAERARASLAAKVNGTYKGLPDPLVAIELITNDAFDGTAHVRAFERVRRGAVVTVFTPDSTHATIAIDAARHGHHVLLAKPAVHTLAEHAHVAAAARDAQTLCAVEFHKRFDPIYMDAVARAARLGPFAYFYSLMTQPEAQLETFRAWAGLASDISYYLNSHHVDILALINAQRPAPLEQRMRPTRVTATASFGVASRLLARPQAEDTITLMVRWASRDDACVGHAVHTSSWAAIKGEAHTQQRFHYMAHNGELEVNQAARGFSARVGGGDAHPFQSINSLYFPFTPSADGRFQGQHGYGYVSIERFVRAATSGDDAAALARIDAIEAYWVTAILEAGRVSLDNDGRPVNIVYGGDGGEQRPERVTVANEKRKA